MKKTLNLLGILAVAGVMGACSDNDTQDLGGGSDAMTFNVKVVGDNKVNTRAASYTNYPDGTSLLIGVNSNNAEINAAMSGKHNTTLTVNGTDQQTFTTNPVLYWNDMGGRDANLNVWGLYVPNKTTQISEQGDYAWQVAADQTAGVLPYDCHWSSNVKGITYKNTSNLIFTHTLSKITVNLTVGEGFTATEAAASKITYTGNYTTVNVHGAKATLTDQANIKDITPAVLKPFNGGMQATYEGIVVPGRQLEVGTELATIVVANNPYRMISKEVRTFESGKNYIYNVSVKKSGINFSVVVADWDEVQGSADTKIVFTAGEGNVGQNGTGVNDLSNVTNSFDIFTSHDNINYDADGAQDGTQSATQATWVPAHGQEGDPDYVPGYWQTDVPIYWQNDADDTYFRGMSPNVPGPSDENGNFELTAGNEDYLWGTSGNDPVNPQTGNVGLQFQHIMSKVVMTVITTDGDDAVDLSTISEQFISQIATTGSFNVGTGKYNAFTAANYGNYTLKMEEIPGTNQKKYTYEFYAIPQVLNDDAKVHITVGEDPLTNTFYQQLNIIKANGIVVNEWEPGKRYVYTLLLKKAEKKFSVMLTDWEDVICEEAEAEL